MLLVRRRSIHGANTTAKVLAKKEMDSPTWHARAAHFASSLYDDETGTYRSVPGGIGTLYGTVYGLLTRHYLGERIVPTTATRRMVLSSQDADTGYFVGPELRSWTPPPGVKHDREHLLLHLTCATLPAVQQFGLKPMHPLRFADRFCDQNYLAQWLERRDMSDAWLEGNNILYVGQILVYLRDVEGSQEAAGALNTWFRWLDCHVDPRTGLWGTDRHCSRFVAMCGGYHQLLVYYHERRPVNNPRALVDIVLALQHPDGGFSPQGGGGACEDADGVDILVNLYKQIDYRRADIRTALRRTLRLILGLQNPDGGFPYKRGMEQSHMGIEATRAPSDVSTMFATWFRVHTLALIAEIVTDNRCFAGVPFRFNSALSMGWHNSWNRSSHPVRLMGRVAEIRPATHQWIHRVKRGMTARVVWYVQRLRAAARSSWFRNS